MSNGVVLLRVENDKFKCLTPPSRHDMKLFFVSAVRRDSNSFVVTVPKRFILDGTLEKHGFYRFEVVRKVEK